MPRVLVLEDDDNLRRGLRRVLETNGLEVLDAADGRGVEILRRQPCDVVVIDLFMPEKNGYEAIYEVRRDYPSTKVVVISGGGGLGSGATALELTAGYQPDATLEKPLMGNELVTVIQDLLGGEQARQP